MSFWGQSPGPHWSDSIWFCVSGAAFPQPIRRYKLDRPSVDICYEADETQADKIAEFLQENFQITEKSKCCLQADRIVEGMKNGWTVVIKLDDSKKIIGVIVSRSLGTCAFHNPKSTIARTPNTAFIDFFCVHPDYRKSGIGSELLLWIEYFTNQKGIFIHFFQKELTPLLSLPPLWQGKYIVREVLSHSINEKIIKKKIQKFSHGDQSSFAISFQPTHKTNDSTLYYYDCDTFQIYLAITNTYHQYGGGMIGEVLFYKVVSENKISEKNIAAAIETIVDSLEYKYILMDKNIPHLKAYDWKEDAPYYYYCYNVNPRHFWKIRPSFWF